jgi:hypothetical protein
MLLFSKQRQSQPAGTLLITNEHLPEHHSRGGETTTNVRSVRLHAFDGKYQEYSKSQGGKLVVLCFAFLSLKLCIGTLDA